MVTDPRWYSCIKEVAASNQQYNAPSGSNLRSYEPGHEAQSVGQCRDDEGTPPSFDQWFHAVREQSYQHFN